MLLDDDVRLVANLCLDHGVPFAVVLMPGSVTAEFYASDTTTIDFTQNDCFFLNLFGNEWEQPLCIPKKMSPADVINKYSGNTPVRHTGTIAEISTVRSDYLDGIAEVVKNLREKGGKTVISRIICGNRKGIDWMEIAERYFNLHPHTFRCIYYTEQTEGWITATPEVLLEYDTADLLLKTMSLAGTRKISDSSAHWDDKNENEHEFVTDYIISVLKNSGVTDIEISESENLKFGNIEHLCHRISGEYSGDILKVIHALSPTPAVAGTPLDEAMKEIAATEKHQRKCYGGYIGVRQNRKISAYVNLRCLNFAGDSYCVYAGGGITSQSVPETEWNETQAKSQSLVTLLNQQ